MAKWTGAVAMAAATMLVAQPVAAADLGSVPSDQRRAAAFGGLKVSLPLGNRGPAKATARLQLAYGGQLRDSRTGSVRAFSPPGLELGASGKGKPMLFVGGQNAAEVERRLGVRGSTGKTILIVGGVLIVLVIVGSVLAAPADLLDPCDGPDDICSG